MITAGAYGGQSGIAAGAWVEIYGSSLASGTREWGAADFSGNNSPTQLDDVRVTVNGKAAPISYISSGQVNIQVPDDVGIGAVPVVVTNHGVSSDPVTVQASAILPGLLAPPAFLANGRQYVVAIAGDGDFAGVPDGFPGGRPARPGEVVTLYGIGFGPVTPRPTRARLLPFSINCRIRLACYSMRRLSIYRRGNVRGSCAGRGWAVPVQSHGPGCCRRQSPIQDDGRRCYIVADLVCVHEKMSNERRYGVEKEKTVDHDISGTD